MDDDPRRDNPRKRLRTSHACDICRSRKIRCDGNTPCSTCQSAEQECTYGAEANPRGKSDLVLDGVRRIEKILEGLSPMLQNAAAAYSGSNKHNISSPLPTASITSPSSSSIAEGVWKGTPRQPSSLRESRLAEANGLDNAVLDSMHTSTTESLLQWPHFDQFPSLKADYVPIFHLEQSRHALPIASSPVYPYVTQDDISSILDSFQHNVNFWYPTLSQNQIKDILHTMSGGAPTDNSIESCLAMLVMALGCASQVTSSLNSETPLTPEERRHRQSRRTIGDIFFEGALKRMHVASLMVSSTSAQCLFFVALYFAFLCRPLQAWEYISAASTKCLMLLSYESGPGSQEDQERTRRVFWACYILESDYIAELSACPVSGIARVESSVPLPSTYYAHSSSSEAEQSSLYFLACISMRRLLNRVHQLLYAKDTGAALNPSRFPTIVLELQHQLEDWREVLPPAFSFKADVSPAPNPASGFLRQRYLTCRSVIYRPYLMWLLSGANDPTDNRLGFNPNAPTQEVLRNCKACLDACLMHILNLRGFSHTVLVDTWICSLSMAGAMLVLLAAIKVPQLRPLLGRDVFAAGDHLKGMLHHWQQVSGGPSSPSVNQSIRMIEAADLFIKDLGSRTDRYDDGMAWRRIEL